MVAPSLMFFATVYPLGLRLFSVYLSICSQSIALLQQLPAELHAGGGNGQFFVQVPHVAHPVFGQRRGEQPGCPVFLPGQVAAWAAAVRYAGVAQPFQQGVAASAQVLGCGGGVYCVDGAGQGYATVGCCAAWQSVSVTLCSVA